MEDLVLHRQPILYGGNGARIFRLRARIKVPVRREAVVKDHMRVVAVRDLRSGRVGRNSAAKALAEEYSRCERSSHSGCHTKGEACCCLTSASRSLEVESRAQRHDPAVQGLGGLTKVRGRNVVRNVIGIEVQAVEDVVGIEPEFDLGVLAEYGHIGQSEGLSEGHVQVFI